MSPNEYQSAMQAALRLLRSRDRTESEVAAALATKGFDEDTVALVVKSLTDKRFLDDRRIAERQVELANSTKPKGRLRLEQELKARGAKDSAVQEALDRLENELETAFKALKAKPKDTPAKSAAYLARLGFEEDTVREAVERVHGEAV